jgi:hypothetical protein
MAAVSSFHSKDGKHDTTVHETVNPAVTNEHVTCMYHEEAQTLIDREFHQDHHQTSIQPITHKEILAEQHLHHMADVENSRDREKRSDIFAGEPRAVGYTIGKSNSSTLGKPGTTSRHR